MKVANTGYEGYLGRITTNREIGEREIVLMPACRFSRDVTDPTKVLYATDRRPGVFLRLADTAAIEIIDAYQSACAKLF